MLTETNEIFIILTILVAFIDSLLFRNINEIHIPPARCGVATDMIHWTVSQRAVLDEQSREIHITSSSRRAGLSHAFLISIAREEVRIHNRSRRYRRLGDAARDETDCKTYIRTCARSCSAGPSILARGAQVYIVV